jgi:hypothetical protein
VSDVPTLVLSPRFHGDSQDMWRAAVARGWGVHRAIRFQPPADPGECFVYGEIMFADMMAARLELALLDPPDDFLTQLPKEWTGRGITFCTAATLPSFNARTFVKPANDKVFQYGVFERSADVPLRYVDLECPILVSEVVEFDQEVRLYVLDGEIRTLWFYRLVGEKTEEQVHAEAREFGQAVLERYAGLLPSAVVLDVGHIEEQGWAVVEANQAYASGIYGEADVNAVLDVCRRSAGPMSNMLERDRRFLRPRIGGAT